MRIFFKGNVLYYKNAVSPAHPCGDVYQLGRLSIDENIFEVMEWLKRCKSVNIAHRLELSVGFTLPFLVLAGNEHFVDMMFVDVQR